MSIPRGLEADNSSGPIFSAALAVSGSFTRPAAKSVSVIAPQSPRPSLILQALEKRRDEKIRRKKNLFRRIFLAAAAAFVLPALVFAQEIPFLNTRINGYVKSLNFFTHTTGFAPEAADSPLGLAEKKESVFSTMERFRAKIRSSFNLAEGHKIKLKIDYDHQAFFGSFVGTGDFRLAKHQQEERQFLDLSQTLVEDDGVFYEHRLYRASVEYENDYFSVEIGRQQIPWGVGHFFTPTDLFNPFNPTQIELEERDGVDAVNIMTKKYDGYALQMVYTPRGKDLHPYRYLARVSKDIENYEVGLIGGRVLRDHVAGFDLQGNIKNSAVRGEFLYREADEEKDFISFTVNADYNFPKNIYGLLEYHFNGRGRRDPRSYQVDKLLRGDIQQLAKNYVAALLGYNITPLLRFENHAIFNADDQSVFLRPELRYEAQANLLFTLAGQFYLGGPTEEFGMPENLYIGELNYSF
jgi:hypothetical protein